MWMTYVAHPLGQGAEREANRERAKRWVRWVARQGYAPVADWIVLAEEHETPENREAGLTIDCALVRRCDVLLLCGGRISPGMKQEVEAARDARVPLVDLTSIGAEPPDGGWELDHAKKLLGAPSPPKPSPGITCDCGERLPFPVGDPKVFCGCGRVFVAEWDGRAMHRQLRDMKREISTLGARLAAAESK